MTTQTLLMTKGRTTSDVGSFAQTAGALFATAVAGLNRFFAPRAVEGAEAAEQLRALAASYADSQPSYAADLAAAADRYEAQVN